MKRFYLVWLAALLCLLCLPGMVSVAGAAKKPVVVWFYTGNTTVAEWAEAFEKQFNATNPDIELSFDLVDYASISEKIIIASASGVGPDISYLAANLIPEQIVRGLTYPLNAYLDRYPDKNDFIPDLFASVTDEKGQIHAMPFAMWSIYDLYNMNVLAEAGVSPPQDWDSMIAAARKMTLVNADRTVARYGYAAPQSGTFCLYNLQMHMEQLGRGFLYIGDTQVKLNNEIGITAANYIRDLWQAGIPDYNNDATLLANSVIGKTAIQGYATYNLLDISPADTAGLEPRRVVGPKPGQDIVRYNAGTLYILPTSQHKDEAWRVIEAFLSPENHRSYIIAQVSYLPVRKSLLGIIGTMMTHPMVPKMAATMYSPMTTYGPVHAYWVSIRNQGASIVLPALQNKAGLQTALEEAERTMNTLLAEKYGLIK